MKYKILKHELLQKLEDDVQLHLDQGWIPHGSLQIINPDPHHLGLFHYIQAVKKK
jgi:hypothetical protein